MPTKIYYKEIPAEDDPDATEPVLIDTLFRIKDALSEKVPEDKETGIKEIKIDLSNLFELADKETKPSVASVGGDKTHIHISRKDKTFESSPFIKDVSKTILHTIPNHSNYTINPNMKITVPSQYRNQWLFYKVEARFGPYFCYPTGGYIPPGNPTFEIKNPEAKLFYGNASLRTEMNVDLHAVTLDTASPEDYADLSEIYAAKGESFAGWWEPLLYLTGKDYIMNYYDDDGGGSRDFNVQGLPKGEFTYRVIGGRSYHSNVFYADWIPSALKVDGSTSAHFSFASPGYGWIFGIHPSQFEDEEEEEEPTYAT